MNQIYGDLGAAGQQAAKQIFLSLVKLTKIEGVLIPVSKSISRSSLPEAVVQQTIDRLVDENLLVSTSKNLSQVALQNADEINRQQATIEIAHEILLSSWKTLQDWIEESKNVLSFKSRIAEDRGRWQDMLATDSAKADEELLKGSLLEWILELRQERLFELQSVPLSAEENQFIDTSVEVRDRQQKQEQERQQRELKAARVITFVASLGGTLMTILGLFAGIQARQAEIQQIQALRSSADAKLASNAELDSMLDSLRTVKILQKSFWQTVLPEAKLRGQVLDQLSKTVYAVQERNCPGEHNRLEGHSNSVYSVAFSPDGKTIASGSGDNTVKLWQFQGGDELAESGCDWVRDCLEHNPNVTEHDRHLCDGIGD